VSLALTRTEGEIRIRKDCLRGRSRQRPEKGLEIVPDKRGKPPESKITHAGSGTPEEKKRRADGQKGRGKSSWAEKRERGDLIGEKNQRRPGSMGKNVRKCES